MAFVVTEGSVVALSRPGPMPGSMLRLADDYTPDYAALYRSQPAVRIVVSFLGRNIGDLGLHLFRRLDDDSRARERDHPVARMLEQPNPRTTRYRMIDATVQDRALYGRAHWLKVKGAGLIRIPAQHVTPIGDNWLWPDGFRITGNKGHRDLDADLMVYFRGYNPDGDWGSSPVESLRQVLAEEHASHVMREQQLRNGARFTGYLKRPREAGSWSKEAKDRFASGWRAQYTGTGPGAGGTPILEDGMEFVAASQTAEQLQYVQARTLTREEAAATFHIPPPMVGLLEHATFSNIKEQHKMLYQDTLGPWLTDLQEDIELQVVREFDPARRLYVEFNLKEKLKGSLEEEAQALYQATGAPWLTRNESRARQNLPAIEGGDLLVTPLNVLLGDPGAAPPPAPAAPGTDVTDPDAEEEAADEGEAPPPPKAGALDGLGVRVKSRANATHTTKAEEVLLGYFRRQKRVVLSALGAKAGDGWWDEARWNRELAADLLALALQTSREVGAKTAEELGFEAEDYDVERTIAFLRAVAESRAAAINATTQAAVAAALADEDEDKTATSVFDYALSHRAPIAAASLVTTWSAFATTEAATQVAPDRATKTWRVTSSNPRKAHARMNGETVGVGEPFSNGAQWPGDRVLGAAGVAGCLCGVEVSIP